MDKDGLMIAGLGYTLASGRLFCNFGDFQLWCEKLLGRPIFTHEFASETLTEELKDAFEAKAIEVLS